MTLHHTCTAHYKPSNARHKRPTGELTTCLRTCHEICKPPALLRGTHSSACDFHDPCAHTPHQPARFSSHDCALCLAHCRPRNNNDEAYHILFKRSQTPTITATNACTLPTMRTSPKLHTRNSRTATHSTSLNNPVTQQHTTIEPNCIDLRTRIEYANRLRIQPN